MTWELYLTKEDRVALKGSIKKWKGVVEGEPERAGLDCPLCKIYFEKVCSGCPISEWVGEIRCDGTPFRPWVDVAPEMYSIGLGSFRVATTPEAIAAAKKELAFLKMLLRIGKYMRTPK